MKWWLFLDDERYPPEFPDEPHVAEEWRLARNVTDAKWMVKAYGLPDHMSLDHDLGAHNFTGMDFVTWLEAHIVCEEITKEFTYHIHSMNPVGKENMERVMKRLFTYWYNK